MKNIFLFSILFFSMETIASAEKQSPQKGPFSSCLDGVSVTRVIITTNNHRFKREAIKIHVTGLSFPRGNKDGDNYILDLGTNRKMKKSEAYKHLLEANSSKKKISRLCLTHNAPEEFSDGTLLPVIKFSELVLEE